MQDFSQLTLGQLLASQDQTIRRGAIQCLKRLQQTEATEQPLKNLKCSKCRSNPKWDIYDSCEHPL